jgi:hypothetical protein
MTRNFRRSMPVRTPLVCGDGLAGRLPGSPLRGQNATSARRRGMSVQPPGADVSVTDRFAPRAAAPLAQPSHLLVSFSTDSGLLRSLTY